MDREDDDAQHDEMQQGISEEFHGRLGGFGARSHSAP
jgi:hypothetical protein